MSALHDALLHANNGPRPLTEYLASMVNPSADLNGLHDGGGVICDFRQGMEERNASLSIDRQAGGTVFHRFGADGFEGGAVDFVMSCLGISKGEAAKLLIDRAGIVDTPPAKGGTFSGPQRATKAQASASKTLEAVSKWQPLSQEQQRNTLKGWVQLTGDGKGQEEQELAGRGLTAALTSGLLTAFRFAGTASQDPTKPAKTYRLPAHFTYGALLLEIRGPDGLAWSYKGRNQGSKPALDAEQKNRYAYPQGSKGVAWCSPKLLNTVSELWIEGELNGVASAYMLAAAGHGAGVQGLAGATGKPHVAHLTAKRRVYIYADSDEAGGIARLKWAGIAQHMGATVYQLPADVFGSGDACEALGSGKAEELGGKLWAAMQAAEPLPSPQAEQSSTALEVWTSKKTGYRVDGGRLCAFTLKQDGGEEYEALEVLCEFSALITAEVTQEDGTGEGTRVFEIEGHYPDGRAMYPPRVPVKAAEFNGMGWPVSNWGAAAIVRAGSAKKDKAREAIQQLSAVMGIAQRTVYQFTGWLEHEQHGPVYLTAGAVIGASGAVDGIDVDLSLGGKNSRLVGYALPNPAKEETSVIRSAVRASLALLDLAPDSVSVPVLGCVYRAALGRLGAVVWLTGETGRGKTAYLGLTQSHYGKNWHREHLPDGWNTTVSALEQAAFAIKDAVFLVDDFKPSGTRTQIEGAYGAVSRIVQGVADGAGRGRMNFRTGGIQAGYHPRGAVMSSAEHLPRGHSNRARAVLVDVSRDLVDTPAKSKAFYAAADSAAAGVYALAFAAYVQTLAGNLGAVRVGSDAHKHRTRELAPHFPSTHGRTGSAAAELAYGWEVYLAFAVTVGAVSAPEASQLWGRVLSALEDTAAGQGEHLHEEDPVNRALSVLAGLLAQGRIYLEDKDAGGPPTDAEFYGWEAQSSYGEGASVSYAPRNGAARLGYVSKKGGDTWAYFLPDALHEVLQSVATKQGGSALPDQSTLYANMRGRLQAAGGMKCEAVTKGGQATGYRPTLKARAHNIDGAARFIVLRLPLEGEYTQSGAAGHTGYSGEESTSSALSSSVPCLSYFSSSCGAAGTAAPLLPDVPSFAAAVPEADGPVLADEEWAGEAI